MHLLLASENLLAFICGIGILQGILFAFLIYFHRKSDRSVNIFLALYILCTSAVMTLPFTMQMVEWHNREIFLQIPFISGPLLYLYIRSFKETITWKKALPHFIPVPVFFILTTINLSILNDKYPGVKEIPREALTRPLTLFITCSKPVQQIIYYILSRKMLTSYRRSIRHLFSETSRIDMRWANFLINGFLVLVLTFIVIFPLILRFPDYMFTLLFANMVIATPYIYIATYKGVVQPSIWQIQAGVTKEVVEEEIHQAEELDAKKQKPAKTGLSDERIDGLAGRIINLMETEKLYQETDLTLRQLAEKLGVPVYQVSQALNEGIGKNFYDLVNGYRVEEAKRLLSDANNRNYTILSTGFEAGFNSKTTFNTVFKKFTGLTPTEYREKHMISETSMA